MQLTVLQLAEKIDAKLYGDGSAIVSSVGTVDTAQSDKVTFCSDLALVKKLAQCKAAAVIVPKMIKELSMPQLAVENVNKALIAALTIFAPELQKPQPGIDNSAVVACNAKIGKGVYVGPQVVIEDGVEIGDNTAIGAGCKIGQNVKIGNDSQLDCNVVVYYNCTIGNRVIIKANTTIGGTGFGYYFYDGKHNLVPHNGSVVIEDFVHIGSNTCIDRGKFGETLIGAGTKIDNLVQIGHNAKIGKCCLMAGQAGIAGSTVISDGVAIGGQAGLIDNLKIGAGAIICAKSLAMGDVAQKSVIFGVPGMDKTEALKNVANMKKLPKLIEQLKQLQARMEKLELAEND